MQLAKIVTAVSALLALVAPQTDVVSAHGVASERFHHDSAARALSDRASLDKCKNAGHAHALESRLMQRRLAKVTELRAQLQQQRQLRRLDAAEIAAKSHRGNASQTKVFAATPKCVLQPETTQGPYHVSGELVRSDLRETQRGVDLHTEIQVIDTATCEPVDNMFLDFWHCNAAGVYSGVAAQGNGGVNDLANLNATFGRGVSATNADGVASFTTKFPGHYAGRATHIHIVGSVNGTVLDNKTYVGARAVHVGQLFFDMDLVEAVEATEPYASNDAVLTKNCVDRIFQQSTAGEFDPVVNYVYLGETVEDGIFSWITVGVDTSAGLAEFGTAATLTASEDVASSADKPRTRPEDGHDHGYGHGDSGVPKASGPKVDGERGAARNTTTQTRLSEEDEPKARCGVFSFFFFVASPSALAAILYKFHTKKQPRKMYAPMNSA